MKGIWYLEWNLSLFWKGSQMSKYIAFEFHSKTNSWTQTVQTCVHNLFLDYVTPTCHTTAASMARFDPGFFTYYEEKAKVQIYAVQTWSKCDILFCNMHWINVFQQVVRQLCDKIHSRLIKPGQDGVILCLLTFGIWWFIVSWVTQQESGCA